MYLDIGVQVQIQQQFEEDSQIELPNFLRVSVISVRLHQQAYIYKLY